MVQAGSLQECNDQSWESYESLHKYARQLSNSSPQNGTTPTSASTWAAYCAGNTFRPLREYIYAHTITATAASHELEEDASGTIADITRAAKTIIIASDTDDNAYDGQTVTVHYISITDGTSKVSTATFNSANSTTEAAFVPPITDFACFDPYYGTDAVVCSVAVQAGDNVCIGVTGAVAGIADPDICFAHINAAATKPGLADMYGAGNIFAEQAGDVAGDHGKVITMEYLTLYGRIRTCTLTLDGANSTTIVRAYDSLYTTIPVGDFWRQRKTTVPVVLGAQTVFLCSHDGGIHYGAIKTTNWGSIHSQFMAGDETYQKKKAFIGRLEFTKSDASTVVTVTLTCQYKGDPASHTETFNFKESQVVFEINRQLEPLTEATFFFNDDNVAHPTVYAKLYCLEV